MSSSTHANVTTSRRCPHCQAFHTFRFAVVPVGRTVYGLCLDTQKLVPVRLEVEDDESPGCSQAE